MSISDLSKLAVVLAVDLVAANRGVAPALVVDMSVFSRNNFVASVTVITSELNTGWKPWE